MYLDIIGKPEGFIAILTSTAIVLISIATLVGVLGKWRWQFDLFSHFRVQYLYLLIGFTGISLLFNDKIISILGISFIVFNLSTIYPLYRSPHRISHNQKTFRILLSNVLRQNIEYNKLCAVIQEAKPDIILLIEVTEAWMQAIYPAIEEYEYVHTTLRSDNYGLALISHYSFTDVQVKYFSNANVPSLISVFDIDNEPLTLIGTHPPPPKSKHESINRNQQLRNIADFITHQEKPYILLGDLNMTSWSPYFRDFIKMSRLRDSRRGFGVQATWPTDKPILMVPIDHVLVSEGITVQNRYTGPDVGSDHRPVIVDFSFDI